MTVNKNINDIHYGRKAASVDIAGFLRGLQGLEFGGLGLRISGRSQKVGT